MDGVGGVCEGCEVIMAVEEEEEVEEEEGV